MPYFPPQHPTWEHRDPDAAGLDPAAIAEAARYAAEHETPWSRDLALMVRSDFGEEPPWNEALGPVRPRGGPNGLVVRKGRIVAEWGDTTQVDLTFSVAKSYLSILAGLAWDRGLIGDLDEPVCRRVDDGGFDPPHNDKITWHHLLQQTSEWEGELWGKPDLIDRNRSVGGRPASGKKGTHRDLQAPGTFLGIQRRPGQPAEPCSVASVAPPAARNFQRTGDGADRRLRPNWEWHGYRNSYVEIDGEADAVGFGRLALGRRGVHPRAGPGADRPPDAARRRLGRNAHPLGGVDPAHARSVPALPAIRLSLVAQHRPRRCTRAPPRRAISRAAPAAT